MVTSITVTVYWPLISQERLCLPKDYMEKNKIFQILELFLMVTHYVLSNSLSYKFCICPMK